LLFKKKLQEFIDHYFLKMYLSLGYGGTYSSKLANIYIYKFFFWDVLLINIKNNNNMSWKPVCSLFSMFLCECGSSAAENAEKLKSVCRRNLGDKSTLWIVGTDSKTTTAGGRK